MKRIAFIVLLLAVSWQVAAQRPLIMSGSPGYMYMPPPTEDLVRLYYTTSDMGGWNNLGYNYDFVGNAFRPGHPIEVYGVALVAELIERYPYLWVYLMEDHIADSVNMCYDLDTVAAELFCFIEQSPVSYADFGFGRSDTIVLPFYEFYFSSPIQVPAGRRFFVGITQSPWNVYNHVIKDNPYFPYLYYNTPWFVSDRQAYNNTQDSSCMWDGLDSTWSIYKYYFPGLIDWTCNRCWAPLANPEAHPYYYKYSSYGFFPIVRPPEDSTRIHPPHVHPLKAGAVGGLRVAELDSAHAVFRWDTLEPSDWGLVGVNAEAYQVNYAPYTEEYAEGDTLMSRGDSCTLFAAFDSTVMYKARCRARSRHVCDIHDTLVWGDWSREVYFHTGVGVPDTAPVECRRVEGLEYLGLEGGRPRFRWERCTEHGLFDVQYAAIGGDGWHRASGTTLTEYVLNEPLDSSWRYMLRVRAQCSHHCHIHDTVMVGEWSDPVEFSLWTDGIEGMTGEAPLFALRPNPARGQAEVTLAEGAAGVTVLTVADAAGREVLRKELSQGTRRYAFSVADLPAGTYFVTLVTRDGTGTKRLVVEGR